MAVDDASKVLSFSSFTDNGAGFRTRRRWSGRALPTAAAMMLRIPGAGIHPSP